jgi:hypothetical protein
MAEPVSCAIISRRNGSSAESRQRLAHRMKNGVPNVCSSRSTAIERPGVSGTLAAATGRAPDRRPAHRGKKMKERFCQRISFTRSGFSANQARIDCIVTSFQRNLAEIGQHPPGAGKTLTGLRRIGDAAQRSHRSSQPRGALDME